MQSEYLPKIKRLHREQKSIDKELAEMNISQSTFVKCREIFKELEQLEKAKYNIIGKSVFLKTELNKHLTKGMPLGDGGGEYKGEYSERGNGEEK